jgi:hypothetical protein
MDCHSDDEQKYGGMLASWKSEADRLRRSVSPVTDPTARQMFETLRSAGLVHNIAATRKILHAIGAQGIPVAGEGSSEDPPAAPADK